MTRRHVEGIVRAQHELGSIEHLHAELSRHDDADVTRLTPITTYDRAMVGRPPPARLRDQVGNGQVADLDEVCGRAWKLDRLVWLFEALELGFRHRSGLPGRPAS